MNSSGTNGWNCANCGKKGIPGHLYHLDEGNNVCSEHMIVSPEDTTTLASRCPKCMGRVIKSVADLKMLDHPGIFWCRCRSESTGVREPGRGEAEKSPLSADGVCRIISACGQARVAKLKFGDLEVEFEGSKPQVVEEAPLPTKEASPSSSEAAISESKREVEAEEALKVDVALQKELQIEEMLLENPLEAEKMLTEGSGPLDLEDEDESRPE